MQCIGCNLITCKNCNDNSINYLNHTLERSFFQCTMCKHCFCSQCSNQTISNIEDNNDDDDTNLIIVYCSTCSSNIHYSF